MSENWWKNAANLLKSWIFSENWKNATNVLKKVANFNG